MAKQNKVTMSIAIDPETHNELKRYAKRRGQSTSSYVHMLIEKALKIDVDEEPMVIGKPADESLKPLVIHVPADNSIMPIVLKIPVSLKGNIEGLKAWMEAKSSGIISKLS